MKNYSRTIMTWLLVLAWSAGCATGRTDFRVIKTTPVAVVTPFATATPEPGKTETPAPIVQPETAPPVLNYTVVANDTLWDICAKVYGDPRQYRSLAQANNIANPDLIHPGQVLVLPDLTQQPSLPLPTASREMKPKPKTVFTPAGTTITSKAAVEFPIRSNKAFGAGERLHFSVEYFGVSAGYATLTIEPGPMIEGRATHHIVAEARTHQAFEWFFKVRDRIESFLDVQGIFPWRYEKHLREGGYSNDSFMIYDQIKHQVIKDKGRTVIDVPPMVQDVISEFYYYRTLDQKVGSETVIPVLADDGKQYEVRVKVIRQEKVRVPAGEFDCLVVEPYLNFEGVFKHQGKIHIWLTNDKRRVPVLIKSGIIIGTIDIVLRDAAVVDL